MAGSPGSAGFLYLPAQGKSVILHTPLCDPHYASTVGVRYINDIHQ